MDFMGLTGKMQENILMVEILRALKRLGGTAKKAELKGSILENSEIIPEEFFTETRTGQTGEYHPSDFKLNFSISDLVFSEFINRSANGIFELTVKGREINPDDLDVSKQVRPFAEKVWKERSKKNKLKKQAKAAIDHPVEVIDESSDDATDDKVESWKEQLKKAMSQMSPQKFELFSRLLIKKMGVTLDEKKGIKFTGDGGIDGFGYLQTDDFRTTRVAVQAKRWSSVVSSPEIDKFRGATDKFGAEYGIFITTSDFTRDAVNAARTGSRVLTLINGDNLVDLVEKYQIHIQPVTTYVLDEFYTEE